MDHNEFEEEKDGIKELTEEEALIVYLRCDEGRGTQLGNVMNTKFYFVSDSMWGTILEEGEPMEYDDKWGKRCQPNYDLLFSSDTRLVVDGLAQLKNWTVELWCKFDSIMQGSIFKSGTFECRIDNGNIKCSNNAYSLKFEESNSDFEEFGEITPIGENV